MMNEVNEVVDEVVVLDFSGIKEGNEKREGRVGGKYGGYVRGKGVCGEVVREGIVRGIEGKSFEGLGDGKGLKKSVVYDLRSRVRGILGEMRKGEWEGKKEGGRYYLRWKGKGGEGEGWLML
jgi:hypothetical protein